MALLPALGGAIGAFTWRDLPVLRPLPPDAVTARNVRMTACYPLIPYSNRIRDARLRFAGADHALTQNFGDHPHAIHGVGWQREWSVVRADAASAVLALAHAATGETRADWPWPFRAAQAFDLAADDDGARLTATLTLINTGTARFPFGLGWHPFFPRDATTTLAFDARDVDLNDATQLPIERVPTLGPWSFATARSPGTATIDNVFGGWRGTATIASAQRNTVTTIAADSACNRLVVFAPESREYFAVEPVTHETDAFNRAAAGEPDTGLRVLPPGAAFSCTMRIAIASRA